MLRKRLPMEILMPLSLMRTWKKWRTLEIEEKGAEEKECLIEELCFFHSFSTLFDKCENVECSKEKENNLEKSEGSKRE